MTAGQHVRAYARESLAWYGGLALLTAEVGRNLRLPPSYLSLVAQQVDVIGVRSAAVALTAALFTGMVLALQTAYSLAAFGGKMFVGRVVSLSSSGSSGRS